MTPRSASMLVAGLLAILLGRLILASVPQPTASIESEWQLPDTFHPVPGAVTEGPFISVPFATPLDAMNVRQDQRVLAFHRFAHTTARMDEDLVPWFDELFDKRWVRLRGRQIGDAPRINAVVLEHITTGERRALAWTMRVGPYTTGRFVKAKLLQIPAKLQGQPIFEIMVLNTGCYGECEQEMFAVAAALDTMLAFNMAHPVR